MTTTEISRVDAAIEHAVGELSKADAVLFQIREEYLEIVVSDETDELGYKRASEAQKRMARLRNDVEKTRKDLKADALRYGKAVDTEAKRIQALIEPIETHLKQQKAIVDDAKARAEQAEQERRVSWLRGRIDTANSIEWIVTAEELEQMPDDVFEFQVIKQRREFEHRQRDRAELEEFRKAKAEKEAEEREAKAKPLRIQLDHIAIGIESVSTAVIADDVIRSQVQGIIEETCEQIRRLV